MSLDCSMNDPGAPQWASFQVSIPFGEAAGVAQIEPESQHVIAMLYAADVLVGAFVSEGETGKILWTRASSARATLVGLIMRSDGNILTIKVERKPGGTARRGFKAFDSATDRVWFGYCSGPE